MLSALKNLEWTGYPRSAALLVAALGLLVLFGWALDVAMIKSLLPGMVAMKANTALCFLLAGCALFLLLQATAPGRQQLAQALALAAAAIGLATLGEHVFGWQLGIDQWLFEERPGAIHTNSLGRMSVYTASGFAAGGLALAALPWSKLRLPTQAAAILTIASGGVPLVGYLWNIGALTTASLTTPAAPHTALGLLMLGAITLRTSLPVSSGGRFRRAALRPVETKILAGFVGALALLVLGGGLTYRASTAFAESAGMVAHTQEVRATLGDLYGSLTNGESAQRAFLLTGHIDQRKAYERFIAEVRDLEIKLSQLIADNPEQAHNQARLHPLIERRIGILAHDLEVYERQGLVAAQKAIVASKSLETMRDIHALADQMEAIEIQLLKQREADTERTRQTTLVLMLTTLTAALLLMTLLFHAIRREMGAREEAEGYDHTHRRALLLYSGSFDRAQILRGLLDLLAERHSYPVSAFYGYEEWQGQLKLEMGRGVPAGTAESFRLGEGLVGEAAKTGQAVALADPESGLLKIETGLGTITPAVLLAVPVIFHELRMGVLVLASTAPLAADEQTFLSHIAGQLGVALSNLKQFNDLKYFSEQLRDKNDEILRKNQQLQDADRAKSEFLANMSHELRTPLNAIIGFSEILKDGVMGEMAEKQRGYIGDIHNSGKHLLSLINDILDLSKVEAGRMTLDLEPIALGPVLRDSLGMLKEQALNHRLKFNLDMAEDPALPEIVADPRKLKQIIYNLLSNAIKFTPDGGSVTLSAQRVDDMLEIAVADTGIGIAKEDQARLFQPFTQIDSSLARKYQGTGLGLVMIKRMAELHGGSVGLESEAGQGARFWVRIPWRTRADQAVPPAPPALAPAALADDLVPARQERTGARASSGEQSVSAEHSPLALVIEDDDMAAELLTHLLETDGLRVAHAATGEMALDWLAHTVPDLITLDLMLPGMDGWEVLARLKQDARLADVPVVIVSIVADAKRGVALGASHVLQKPVSHAELSNALRAIGLVPVRNNIMARVLVVDDDPHAVNLLSSFLVHDGYQVSTSYSGEEGIALARAEKPDAILLDLMMPEVTGFEVVESLKTDPGTALIPIIVITAKILTAADRERLNGHVQAILEKADFNHEKLSNEVRRVMRSRRKRES